MARRNTNGTPPDSHPGEHGPDTRLAEPVTFPQCLSPTLGVELEVSLIDRRSGDLAPRANELLEKLEGDNHFKPELFETIIELNTGVCTSVADIVADLRSRFEKLFTITDPMGIDVACVGTHPSADWRVIPISPGERYQGLVGAMQWPARRLLICGTHVHVGVQSGEHAVALVNALKVFLPHLLALSGSSPYWMGQDTGLASSRLKVFESLPTAGLPPPMMNWSEFVQLMRTLLAAESIRSIREIWWDIRPHPGFGTVEVRVCDGINTLDEVAAITALVQCLASYIQDLYNHGDPLPGLREWTLKENKWRACRHGLDAMLIRNERGHQVPLREHTEEWLTTLAPTAKKLGCAAELEGLRAMFENPNYVRQRRWVEEHNSLPDMIKELTGELRSSWLND